MELGLVYEPGTGPLRPPPNGDGTQAPPRAIVAGLPWTLYGPGIMVSSYGLFDGFPGAPKTGQLVNLDALVFDTSDPTLNLIIVKDVIGNTYLTMPNGFDPDRLINCYRYLYSDEAAIRLAKLSASLANRQGFICIDTDPDLQQRISDVGDYWSVANGKLQRLSSSGYYSPIQDQARDPWVRDVYFPFDNPVEDWDFAEQGMRGSVNLWTRVCRLEYIKGMDAERCAAIKVGESVKRGFIASLKGFGEGFAAGGFVGAVVGAVTSAIMGHIDGWNDASHAIFIEGTTAGSRVAKAGAQNTSTKKKKPSTLWQRILAFLHSW